MSTNKEADTSSAAAPVAVHDRKRCPGFGKGARFVCKLESDCPYLHVHAYPTTIQRQLWCGPCNKPATGPLQLAEHKRSSLHRDIMKECADNGLRTDDAYYLTVANWEHVFGDAAKELYRQHAAQDPNNSSAPMSKTQSAPLLEQPPAVKWSAVLGERAPGWQPSRSERSAMLNALGRGIPELTDEKASKDLKAVVEGKSDLSGEQFDLLTHVFKAIDYSTQIETTTAADTKEPEELHSATFLPIRDHLYMVCGQFYEECRELKSATKTEVLAKSITNNVSPNGNLVFWMYPIALTLEVTRGGVVHSRGKLYQIPLEMMAQLARIYKHEEEMHAKLQRERIRKPRRSAGPGETLAKEGASDNGGRSSGSGSDSGSGSGGTKPIASADEKHSGAKNLQSDVKQKPSSDSPQPQPSPMPMPPSYDEVVKQSYGPSSESVYSADEPVVDRATRYDGSRVDVNAMNALLAMWRDVFATPNGAIPSSVVLARHKNGQRFMLTLTYKQVAATALEMEAFTKQVRDMFLQQFDLIVGEEDGALGVRTGSILLDLLMKAIDVALMGEVLRSLLRASERAIPVLVERKDFGGLLFVGGGCAGGAYVGDELHAKWGRMGTALTVVLGGLVGLAFYYGINAMTKDDQVFGRPLPPPPPPPPPPPSPKAVRFRGRIVRPRQPDGAVFASAASAENVQELFAHPQNG